MRYAKDEQDAKDIFQEAFIKIFKQLKNLGDPTALDTWMRKIAVHTAIDFYHHQMKTKMNDCDIILETRLKNEEYEKMMDNLNNEQLVGIINDMPVGYRMVFNMYVMEGYKHREIAELLSISENTSKSQLKDAKIYLKKRLLEMGIMSYEVA